MRRGTMWVLAALLLGLANVAGAQCDDPNNLLTADQCGFDTPASVGPDAWRPIPQATPWDPDYGTVAHSATGGRTSPGSLIADAAANADPFGTYYVGSADICVPHVTVPGDVIESNGWVQVSSDPANLWYCNVNVVTTNADCTAGHDYAFWSFTPAAAATWTEMNPDATTLEAVTGGDAISYNVSCWGDQDVEITLDDVYLGLQVPPPVRVLVTARGSVEWNQVTAPPLGNASAGDPVEMRFTVRTDDYVDGVTYPTRGYVIEPESFELRLGDEVVGLQDPFPAGTAPYFAIRNDDPAVDGFMLVLNPDAGWPTGIYLDQAGILENFLNNFYVTYDGTVLSSLDIMGALGVWDFDQLTVYNWTIDDAGFNAIGIAFTEMEISDGGVFADGFESGDAGAWTPMPVE